MRNKLPTVLVGFMLFSQILYSEIGMLESKRLVETESPPIKIRSVEALDDGWFADFGKAAFGTVRFRASAEDDQQLVTVHLGEVLDGSGERIDREPGGTRRYRAMTQPLKKGTHWYRVSVTPDERNTNTGAGAVLMPEEIGEVMPFRYCELEGFPGPLKRSAIRQIGVHYPFDDQAASFESSSKVLNDVWELCKYSIKATSFSGVYVDGDRERIPYEGDAYINQLAHYCLDTEYAMGRRSLEYLLDRPTWPVEWHQHIPLMVWEEYLYTGDLSFARENYDRIVAKLLRPLARVDGLLEVVPERMTEAFLSSISMTKEIRTLVDWPRGERDGHEIKPVDSVVNAFYYKGLGIMSQLAAALGKSEESARFEAEARLVFHAYQEAFYDERTQLYRDGEGSEHSSFHANFFPLAFGLVPEVEKKAIIAFIKSKGMATSVYGAQHLVDGLFINGFDEHAISLLASTEERSWAHMIYDVGSTITLEAWDNRFKPNQDWNHAWGAAPANLIPRRLMGITPIEPGFAKARIAPQIGDLDFARLRHPTARGPIQLEVKRVEGELRYRIRLPREMAAEIQLPGESEPRQYAAKPKSQLIRLVSD